MVQEICAEPDFLFDSAELRRIRDICIRIADKDVPVLILGESGVGKEVVARFIHARSERRDRPFLKINCAAVPYDLLESELFGYEQGAFSGATRRQTGLLEAAEDGTIVLDEIAEMARPLQAKLLHVLQDLSYCRVGGRRAVAVKARIIAMTNKPLEKAVANGEFREDLYFRLAVIKLEIPPLRKRMEDVPILTDHFLRKYSQHFGSVPEEFPQALLDAYMQYDWPGNVRQLENMMQRYLLLSDVDSAISEVRRPARQDVDAPSRPQRASLLEIGAKAAERAEKHAVLRALEETDWNRKAAADKLNVSYKTLLNKLHKWEIHRREDLRRSSGYSSNADSRLQ